MLAFLILTVSCFVRDFDESLESHLSINKELTLGFFYNNNLKDINEYKKMLNRVIKYTKDFEILMVNCSKYLSICIDKSADPLPAAILYLPKGKHGITMSLEISLYNIITFITERTNIKPRLPKSQIIELNRNNFASFFYTGDYHIIEYFEEHDQASEMLDISYEEISNIYSEDNDIKFGRVNCTNDIKFCLEVGTSLVPIIRLYKHGWAEVYSGIREVPYIVNFINDNCKKHRSINGEYKHEFDDSIEEIVKNFMKKPNKKEFINQIETHTNGQAFSLIMNRIMKDGSSAINNMISNLHILLNDPNVKGESQDRVSEKISMLKIFQKYYPYVGESEL